jgi:phenylalanyl-tRNA synthetase alpha chain
VDTPTEIDAGLDAIRARYRERFSAAPSEQDLRNVRAELLGKKGELTALLRGMGSVPAEQRRAVGERVNALRDEVEKAFETSLKALQTRARQSDLDARPYDLTLPARVPVPRGHVHPITLVLDEILDVFRSLGFEVAWGPEVEFEANNFTKLAFPPDHPATDMQDSFWVKVAGQSAAGGDRAATGQSAAGGDRAATGQSAAGGDRAATGASSDVRTLLRTHTSTVQVREMSSHSPPMAIVSGGAVYRRDDDVTHSPMFHQVEGFLVDEHVNFGELKGVLTEFARRLYGSETRVRFRPSYFPFVEPGAELDVSCTFCRPDDGSRAACRVCKASGWLEILGCGMIHPAVFEHCGIDAERYTGFAFGLGVERVAMLRYEIPDIRLLFENDPRFLAQF